MPPIDLLVRLPKIAGWLLLVFLVIGFSACTPEDDGEDLRVDPWLFVRELPLGQPLAGIKVVLMDPDTNVPVAGPVISDAAGKCTFPGLGDGPYQVVPFGGATHFVVNVQPYRWDLTGWPDKDSRWSLTGPEKTPPAPVGPEVNMEAYGSAAGLPRIAGLVVDAATGEPLARAFVGTSPYPGGYTGRTTFRDDVTDAEGRFTVSEILFGQDPQSGNLVQLQPLLVFREGYRPLSWTYDAPNGSDNTDITGATIELEPFDPEQTGSLTGRIILQGSPADGVVVTAARLGPDKSTVGMPGIATQTDDEGVFLLEGLAPGIYFVEAGYLPGDGVVYPDQPGNVGREVVVDQTTDAGDLVVLHEIQLYSPASGGWYATTGILFPMTWSAVPGATQYLISVDRGWIAETGSNRLDAVEDFNLSDGPHVWSVVAYDEDLNLVGMPHSQTRFYLNTPLD